MAQIPAVVVEAGEGDLDEKMGDVGLSEKDQLPSDVGGADDPLTEKAERTAPPDAPSKELPRPPLPDSNSNQTTN